ncbi:AraC family transcriptional regulator [Pontimicrobium sp. SW4]|uniref:AraC family transcriptional regulator n=1 Tax=Pontimicrobium sp. SW4 TaxID=3153519 RepID=A0AAU7BWR8_9FLAO
MDTFKTIQPKCKDLSKRIAYYYFHESKNENFSKDIIYHPHYLVALNVYKNVRVVLNEKGRTYIPVKSNQAEVLLTINNKTSKVVRLRGSFNKIGIVFYPLGINHFINRPLSEVVTDNRVSRFDYFGKDFITISDLAFRESNLKNKREILDSFFKSHFKKIEEERIVKAVNIIFNATEIPKVKELASNLSISRKTLLRLFRKHLCFSVEEFKSVVKFRRALTLYEAAVKKPSLTQVAIENQYYDQPEFINHFKSLTGFNPKKFFSSTKQIHTNGPHWTF